MIASIILIALAGIAKAIMDASADGKLDWKPHDYWLKNLSWVRKWQRDAEGNPIEPLEPAFFGSTTFLVVLTDGWHLAQFAFLNLMLAAMVCYEPILTPFTNNNFNSALDVALLGLVLRVVFQLSYSRLERE